MILKKTCSIRKVVTGKRKVSSDFPNKLLINDIEITDKIIIANRIDQFFVNIGP